MNRRMILYMPLQILRVEALVMLLPTAVSLAYREMNCVKCFLLCAAAALIIASAASAFIRPANKTIYAKEGFVIVALSWVLASALGAMPFWISGEIPHYVDAFFETVSGFTTTGASILRNVEAMSRGLLFWRSFTHWMGGMGILVFFMAIVNVDGPIHIMRAEMPGPIVGKFVPKARDTAKILYLIYIALTALEIVLLMLGGMTLFEASTHAMATAGTGGFGVLNTSIASYSPYLQWVVTIFMMLFGVNFNIYFLLLIRKFRSVLFSSELWAYLGIIVAATALICVDIRLMYHSFGETLRVSAFQVSSIITTTGFSTTDFDQWPGLSKAILLFLMVVGACAGSTGGGLKVSRLLILGKAINREFRKMLHPRSVNVLRLEGKALDESVVSNTLIYFVIYCVITGVCFLMICFDKFNLETAISATVACFNNIGPAFGAAGPARSYAEFSDFSKLVLSAAMLLGRLEIFPILLAVSPVTWIKK